MSTAYKTILEQRLTYYKEYLYDVQLKSVLQVL